MKTTIHGWRWFGAMVEGALIRIFSEWGRVVGILERGDFGMLFRRFDWFCGTLGDGPKQEEKMNNRVRLAMTAALFAVLAKPVSSALELSLWSIVLSALFML